MKLRAILIDDEPASNDNLERDIEAYDLDIEILAKCNSGKEGIDAIKKFTPDLIFLDAKMPRMDGFGMLELLEDIDFEIIFVSGFSEYAFEAFKFSALHYLLKPVDEDDLREAVERVQRKKDENVTSKEDNMRQIKELIKNLQADTDKRFAIPTMSGYDYCLLNDIIYLKAKGAATKIITINKTYVSGHNIGKFEDRLPKNIFRRIHNSHIVNINYVTRYIKGENAKVKMTNGHELKVSAKGRIKLPKW